jgi:preprotein translocase subunit SecD
MHIAERKIFLLLLIVSCAFSCKTISKMTSKGGSEFTVQVETNEPNKDEIFQQAINKLENEMNIAGINGEVNKIPDKPYQLDVKIYDPKDIEKDKQFLFTNYQLELKEVVSPPSPAPVSTYPTEAAAKLQATENQEVIPYTERGSDIKKFVVVKKEPIITGKDLRSASAMKSFGGENNYAIQFSLKKDGAEKLGIWTGSNINKYLAIVLNKEITSVAFIKSAIYDSGQIDGRFTKEDAENIAFSLQSGHLPATFNVLSETVFGK